MMCDVLDTHVNAADLQSVKTSALKNRLWPWLPLTLLSSYGRSKGVLNFPHMAAAFFLHCC